MLALGATRDSAAAPVGTHTSELETMAANEISGTLRARPAMDAIVVSFTPPSQRQPLGVRSPSDQLFITL